MTWSLGQRYVRVLAAGMVQKGGGAATAADVQFAKKEFSSQTRR